MVNEKSAQRSRDRTRKAESKAISASKEKFPDDVKAVDLLAVVESVNEPLEETRGIDIIYGTKMAVPHNITEKVLKMPTSLEELESDERFVGQLVWCKECGLPVRPTGRSVPDQIGAGCVCEGRPEFDLWPGERREDFGYPVLMAHWATYLRKKFLEEEHFNEIGRFREVEGK